MQAVVYKDKGTLVVEKRKRTQPANAVPDAISAAIRGSDSHVFEQWTPAKPGAILEHEVMGRCSDGENL